MKFPRVCGVIALVLLIVPLAGCLGSDETAPEPKIDEGGKEIDEGVPPKKFSFDPAEMAPDGVVKKEKEVRKTGNKLLPDELKNENTYWRFTWNVTGLVPINPPADEGALPEAFYSAWVAQEDDSREEGVVWERVIDGESAAADGTLSGATGWEVRFGNYLGVLITLETEKDSSTEMQLLKFLPFKTEKEAKGKTADGKFEFLDPFKNAFADATVEMLSDGKINLTVTAFTLPETEAVYDLFLKNGQGNHFLGTLKFDAGQAAYTFSTQPDPKLFTKYQFFISLEDKENKETHGGFKMLTSTFSK